MFCIAAFIVLAIISIFSASHRKLAKKAWNCTLRRVTLRPCDSSFKEETKNKLLSHVANKTPNLVKLADIGIEIASFILVILTIWSLAVVLESGLNLFVWGTCNPNNAASCSLSSETCSIDRVQKNLWDLTLEGKPHVWFIEQVGTLGNTLANIPVRLQSWDANKFTPENATYYFAKDTSKPYAIEAIDPGCIVCSQLFKNIKEAGFESNYNLTYIAYPIENPAKPGEYKFPNSYLVTTYLESIKINPISTLKTPADWQIIERIFTWKDSKNISYQSNLNLLMNQAQTKNLIRDWLKDIGYTDVQIEKIDNDANSEVIANIIKKNKEIVDKEIRTVSIPTIIFDGRRHNGLVKTSDLK